MRKETDHLLNSVQRHRQPLSERDEFVPGEIPVFGLKFVKFLNDHGGVKLAQILSCTFFSRSSLGSKPVGES